MVGIQPSSSSSIGCMVTLRGDWAVFYHSGSGRVGRVSEKPLEIHHHGWEFNQGCEEDRPRYLVIPPLSYRDWLSAPSNALSAVERGQLWRDQNSSRTHFIFWLRLGVRMSAVGVIDTGQWTVVDINPLIVTGWSSVISINTTAVISYLTRNAEQNMISAAWRRGLLETPALLTHSNRRCSQSGPLPQWV